MAGEAWNGGEDFFYHRCSWGEGGSVVSPQGPALDPSSDHRSPSLTKQGDRHIGLLQRQRSPTQLSTLLGLTVGAGGGTTGWNLEEGLSRRPGTRDRGGS